MRKVIEAYAATVFLRLCDRTNNTDIRRQDRIGYQACLGAPDTSVEFQRVNSRICVAMMVFAPIYVAQM